MKYLQETTEYTGLEYTVPLHTYVLDNRGWCVGYIKVGTESVEWFKFPMKSFSKSRRKFKDVTKRFS